MPLFETFFRRLNAVFTDDGLAFERAADLDMDSPTSLRDMMRDMDMTIEGRFDEFIGEFPPALTDGLKAAVRSASRSRKPITFQWSPAYDFELHIYESRDYEGSPGGVSIHVRSRYPNDPHPQGPPPASAS